MMSLTSNEIWHGKRTPRGGGAPRTAAPRRPSFRAKVGRTHEVWGLGYCAATRKHFQRCGLCHRGSAALDANTLADSPACARSGGDHASCALARESVWCPLDGSPFWRIDSQADRMPLAAPAREQHSAEAPLHGRRARGPQHDPGLHAAPQVNVATERAQSETALLPAAASLPSPRGQLSTEFQAPLPIAARLEHALLQLHRSGTGIPCARQLRADLPPLAGC
mmetsp:Transcript_65696/g.157022  ORF Transcript_65696/g.157022 Transcript_65696/m.157022 type:complete len:223 (+) Transcript_65696:253-921(+)